MDKEWTLWRKGDYQSIRGKGVTRYYNLGGCDLVSSPVVALDCFLIILCNPKSLNPGLGSFMSWFDWVDSGIHGLKEKVCGAYLTCLEFGLLPRGDSSLGRGCEELHSSS